MYYISFGLGCEMTLNFSLCFVFVSVCVLICLRSFRHYFLHSFRNGLKRIPKIYDISIGTSFQVSNIILLLYTFYIPSSS